MKTEFGHREQLQQGAINFGKTLIAWRKRNGWTQYTIEEYAQSVGFDFPGPGHLSQIENGRSPHLRPETFLSFADLNNRLFQQNRSDLIKIIDPKTRKIIEKSIPIETFACGIWQARHFFAHFIGELNAPSDLYVEPPVPPVAESKEQAFMMLNPRRFQVIGNQIACPEQMTKKEAGIIHFLCKDYEYLPLTEK